MSAIFDILLIAIVGIFVIVGAKKGLIKSISGFLVYIFSFSLANYFYIPAMLLTDRIGFIADLKNPVYAEGALAEVDRTDGFLSHISDIFSSLFSAKAVLSDGVEGDDSLVSELLAGNTDEISDRIAAATEVLQGQVNYLIGDAVSAVIAFLAVFIVALLVLKLAGVILNAVFTKTPGLKQVNGLLGAVFGVLCGLFWAWVTAKLFVSFLFPILNAKFPLVFPAEMVESLVVLICLKVNPLYFLLLITKGIASLFTK